MLKRSELLRVKDRNKFLSVVMIASSEVREEHYATLRVESRVEVTAVIGY